MQMNIPMTVRRMKHRCEEYILSSSSIAWMVQSLVRDYHRFQHTRKEFCAKTGAAPFDFDNFRPLKTSDTLFVLGSGNSINEMGEAEWDIVRQHDSIGFNFWPIHPFVPTYFFWEVPGEKKRRNVMLEILRRKKTAYADTPFILKRLWPNQLEAAEEMLRGLADISHHVALSLDIPPKKNEDADCFSDALKKLHRTGILKLMIKLGAFWFRRATLSEITAFSAGMGYKEIVLCGVDLNDTGYFFDVAEFNWEGQCMPVPPKLEATLHPTMDTSKNPLTVDLVLKYLNQVVLEAEQCRLFVANPRSRLSASLPVFDFTEFSKLNAVD